MSILRPVLNTWLRRVERPFLQRVTDPVEVRAGFARKAKLYFRVPLGMKITRRTLSGRDALTIEPKGTSPNVTLLYLHGGAYVFGSPETHKAMVAKLCKVAQVRAIVPDYRKGPEHPFPAAIEDAEAFWDALCAEGLDPGKTVIGGDSAGGGLALALLARLIEKGGACPAGLFAFSALTDLSFSGKSIQENRESEVLLPPDRIGAMSQMVLAGANCKEPRISPLFADFRGAPPIWLTAGDTEVLRDDTLRMANVLSEQGVDCALYLEKGLPHVWPIFHNTLPEARQTLRNVGAWIREQTRAPA